MKTILTDQTIADLLIVLKALPQEEIDQIEAFGGDKFDIDTMAMQLANSNGPRWTIRLKDTGEPIAVAGLFQVGTSVWRTWFMANQRAWDEFGREVTVHVAKTRKEILNRAPEHARIETLALASRQRKVFEWYEACGMVYESTMLGYGVNGESAVMYVSTKGARNY